MNNYLKLISLSRKYNRTKNSITIVTVIISVCLVVTIISSSRLALDLLIAQEKRSSGDFHVQIKDVSSSDLNFLKKYNAIDSISEVNYINQHFSLKKENNVNDNEISGIICLNNDFFNQNNINIVTGKLFNRDNEIILHKNQLENGFNLGDKLTLHFKNNQYFFEISGFYDSVTGLDKWNENVAISSFNSIYKINPDSEIPLILLKFKDGINIKKEMNKILELINFDESKVSYNENLLIYMGQSNNNFILQLYGIVIVLMIIIILASILMIHNNFTSNVKNQQKFYGLLRCIGATRKQVIKYVMWEAIYTSFLSIPSGSLLGIVISIFLGYILKLIIPEYFVDINIVRIYLPSVFLATLVAILTVVISALMPSLTASKISPLSAINDNYSNKRINFKINALLGNIEFTVGIKNALENMKNLISISLSLGLTIVCFLSFTIIIDFIGISVKSLDPLIPDIEISSDSNDLDNNIVNNFINIKGVKKVYGRSYFETFGNIDGKNLKINLISIDDYQAKFLKNNLKKRKTFNNQVYTVLVFSTLENFDVGENINILGKNVKIEGILSKSLYTDANDKSKDATIFVSEKLFLELTGISKYMVVDLQTTNFDSQNIMHCIQNKFNNKRDVSIVYLKDSNNEAKYMSLIVNFTIYSFLIIIWFIGALNIYNSVFTSLIKKIKILSTMRSIGTTLTQIKKMFLYETLTYSLVGSILGTIIGVFFHRKMYFSLIYSKYGINWSLPLKYLLFLYFSIFLISYLSTIIPLKNLKNASIISCIN